MEMNKKSSAQGSTKSLLRSYSIESMDSDTDHIVASLNLEGTRLEIWKLQDLKSFSCAQTNELNPFFKCYLQIKK